MNILNMLDGIIAPVGGLTAIILSILNYKAENSFNKEILKLQIKRIYAPLYKILTSTQEENTTNELETKITNILKIFELEETEDEKELEYLISTTLKEQLNLLKIQRTEKRYKKFKKFAKLEYKKARNSLRIFPREKYSEVSLRNTVISITVTCIVTIMFSPSMAKLKSKTQDIEIINEIVNWGSHIFNVLKYGSATIFIVLSLGYAIYLFVTIPIIKMLLLGIIRGIIKLFSKIFHRNN